MSGINSGILQNAEPLSAEAIKELERQVLENNAAYAYLDQDSKLCFAIPHGVDGIKKLAWNNAYELSSENGTLTKKVYKKTGLKTYRFDKVFNKSSIDQSWTESYPDPGLYKNGRLVHDWEYLTRAGALRQDGTEVCLYGEAEELDGDLVIAEGITTLPYRAFDGCYHLTSVILPSTVIDIGESAFEACTAMTHIVIPQSVTSIGTNAFMDCYGLTSITIAHAPILGTGVFAFCDGMTSATLNNTTIPVGTFSNCTSLINVNISEEADEICDYAFNNCTSLRSISLPWPMVYIGECSFENCTSLTNIDIPGGVTEIGTFAFSNCTNLASVALGHGTKRIGEGAFNYCTSLKSIIIPATITTICGSAFASCTALTRFIFNGSVDQWNQIKLLDTASGEGWNSGMAATEVVCSDGVVKL